MLCIIIPTLGSGDGFVPLLQQVCRDETRVVISDGGSQGATLSKAAGFKTVFAVGTSGRGTQLARGARWSAGAEWMLFIHGDCVLPDGWADLITRHIREHPDSAAYFRFGAAAAGLKYRFMEYLVGLRSFWLKLPYGDQGLLISRAMYDAVGGYPEQALFEDVHMVRAIRKRFGRKHLRGLRGKIMTDVSAYARDGFWRRTRRNLELIFAYNRGEDVAELAKRYK